ncbi:MAG TPA: zinc chelation protein SecC [Alteromonas sp.]|nr:zinc chelation protein SecC [Aestuariibacter sp.]MAP21392.1 zinc chelation protein SecC [Alteromonadaceae bacterium]HBY38178.1 zinc chelation protein SecC [Alteromonas sp.]|tara:strand:- start:8112 stop:8585 length:474 start_codon:yes stop_codon:yes gene_type:complete
MVDSCYCCSSKPYEKCCAPYHSGAQTPPTPEALMRSRYAAYCIQDWPYILKTYAEKSREGLTEAMLAEHADEQTWLHLSIVPSPALTSHQVEFKAYYAIAKQCFVLHETSDFETEAGEWRYTTGLLHDDTGKLSIGRNDACLCDSGKKFKQCCLKRL